MEKTKITGQAVESTTKQVAKPKSLIQKDLRVRPKPIKPASNGGKTNK